MTLRYLLIISSLLLFFACSTGNKLEITPNGYSFKYHLDRPGDSPDAGDEIFYRMYMRNSDTILYRSFENSTSRRPFSILRLPDFSIEANKPKAHEDVLSVMSPGDSVTIFYSIDSLTVDEKPDGFKDEDYIFYDLVMVDFKKKEYREQKKAKPLPVDDYELTPDGYPVVFHVNKEGASPKNGEYIHFRMYLRSDDGVVFASNKGEIGEADYTTAPFLLTRKPSPQMDAFSIMSPGDSLTLYYQIDTLDRKPKGFEDSDMVYYDIVLLDVLNGSEHSENVVKKERILAAEKQAIRDREPEIIELLSKNLDAYKKNELGMKLRKTNTGLEYMVLEKGNGKSIETGNEVKHHFYCMTADGDLFGGSFMTGETYGVLVGTQEVINGWENGLRLFEEGSKGILFIPAAQAYGEKGLQGKVPPNTDLVFYLDIEEVKK